MPRRLGARPPRRCRGSRHAGGGAQLLVGGAGADAEQQRDVARRGRGSGRARAAGRARPPGRPSRRASRAAARRRRSRRGPRRSRRRAAPTGVGCGTPCTCRTPPRTVRPSTGSAGATISSPASASSSATTFPRSSESIFLNVIRPSSARTRRAASSGAQLARVQVDDVAVGVAERDPPARPSTAATSTAPERSSATTSIDAGSCPVPWSRMPANGPCPNCGGQLVQVERSGVRIDACRQCRGVFLDRGELDQILERERSLRRRARTTTTRRVLPRDEREPGLALASRATASTSTPRRSCSATSVAQAAPHKKSKKSFLDEIFD